MRVVFAVSLTGSGLQLLQEGDQVFGNSLSQDAADSDLSFGWLCAADNLEAAGPMGPRGIRCDWFYAADKFETQMWRSTSERGPSGAPAVERRRFPSLPEPCFGNACPFRHGVEIKIVVIAHGISILASPFFDGLGHCFNIRFTVKRPAFGHFIAIRKFTESKNRHCAAEDNSTNCQTCPRMTPGEGETFHPRHTPGGN